MRLLRAKHSTLFAVCLAAAAWFTVLRLPLPAAAESDSRVAILKNFNDGSGLRTEFCEQIFRSAGPGEGPVPAISATDLASGLKPIIVAGTAQTLSGGPEKLTDGVGASKDDDPPNCFFFDNGIPSGLIRISLPTVQPIAEVNLYAWHRNALSGGVRAPIKLKVYVSDGTAPGFVADNPQGPGYTLLANIDTTRPGGPNAQSGQHGASVRSTSDEPLGHFQHFLFEVVSPIDNFTHTFLTEIDIVQGTDRSPSHPITVAGVHFDEHIAPLLARRCLDCHNPTDKKGGLDLSRVEAAMQGGDSGVAIAASRPDESLLLDRVTNDEMPPKHPLPENEKQLLREWIAAGATWGTNPIDRFQFSSESRAGYDWWSLQPVVRPSLPDVKQATWPLTDIDRFILARLESKGLTPAAPTDRRTLIRRVTFDLIGLPPTPDEVAVFEQDQSPDAYARLVDRLLASPHYGERWARHWLDIVRFAESQGFERNKFYPSAWKYRDWVIQSLNDDLPYDEFVRRQLAGDVIAPDDPQSAIATRYLVCSPYDILGSTLGSAGMKAAVAEEELENLTGNVAQTFLGLTINCARCHDHKFDPLAQSEYFQLASALGGLVRRDRQVPYQTASSQAPDVQSLVAAIGGDNAKAQFDKARADAVAQAEQAFTQLQAEYDKIKGATDPVGEEQQRIFLAAEDNLHAARSPVAAAGLDRLLDQVPVNERPAWQPLIVQLSLAEMRERLQAGGVVQAFESKPPQYYYVLSRGSFNSPEAVVTPRGFKCVAGLPNDWGLTADAPESQRRLRLAQWITDSKNPLAARTLVNRLWHYHFGVGIVDTPNDLGFSGGRPSHPELLDWLASEFVTHGWSLKHLHRQIVLSATYQQSSQINNQAFAIDAGNRLLWRKSPQRMDAETVRDTVLAICGQLNPRLGGPSSPDVKQGLQLGANTTYQGSDAFDATVNRRTIYRTVVRATTAPFLETLDCANPTVSTPRRSVTTTPLQALTLLNNSFMEKAAAGFAERVGREAGADVQKQIERAYRLAFGRVATAAETERGTKFTAEFGLADLCLMLLNSNEFLYLD